MILLLGFLSSFSQQTPTVIPIDETGAMNEHSNQVVLMPDDSPVLQPGDIPTTTPQQASEPGNTIQVQPAGPDETTSPEGPTAGISTSSTGAAENQAIKDQDMKGPDEATGPIMKKPD